jgi:ABC-type polysaccharide/polyol phosphate export permease
MTIYQILRDEYKKNPKGLFWETINMILRLIAFGFFIFSVVGIFADQKHAWFYFAYFVLFMICMLLFTEPSSGMMG